ncbi:sulfotransferase [Elysia marginata]|uniref:Sulfotransferase n=1 Tax=Elysia marginata TaxID=1093978 RepID=A0AAV4JX06_9GAST|nr:sulfotransferase [Elysia marginata]
MQEYTQKVTLEHLRIVLWTVLGSSVLVSLLTSVAMMNTTLKKIEVYNHRTELAHQHELEYQRKILLGNNGKPSPMAAKVSGLTPSELRKAESAAKTPSKPPNSKSEPESSVPPKSPTGFGSSTPSEKKGASSSFSSSGSSPSSPPTSPWSSTIHSSPPSSASSSSTATDLSPYKPPPGETKEHRFPKVIIVGVSKCGTRALLDYLALHPNVIAANKEINFFTNVSMYNKGPEVYKNSMPLSYSDQLTVEKSPDYFECEMCPERIIAIDRTIKLLLILCNPVDRLVSQYMQLKEKNDQSGTHMAGFEEWSVDPMTNTVRKNVASIRTGMYDQYMTNWFRFFHQDKVHVIDGATFIKDPVGEMRKVETFLEIKHYLTSEDIYYNATKGFHCMYSRIAKKSHCLGPTKGRPHIKVLPGVYQTLQTYYNPHNARLKSYFNYQMSWV